VNSSTHSLPFPTLAATLVRQDSVFVKALLVLSFSLLTGLAAQLAIPLPWTPVPITGQTFAVLLTGAVLGPRLGALSMVLYVAEGAAGLPFFAGGTGGPAVLVSPSAGYLYSYPFAAGLVGWFTTRGWDRQALRMALAMLLGSAVIYAFGLVWLGGWLARADQYPGFVGLLNMGMTPFLPGDAIKAVLAMAVLPPAWKLVARSR
jgi:biotin transport system substrate-specific component